MTVEHDQRLRAYLLDNRQMHAAINQLADEYEEQVALHLVEQEDVAEYETKFSEPSPTRPGEVIIRHLHTEKPIAVIHTDGEATRL